MVGVTFGTCLFGVFFFGGFVGEKTNHNYNYMIFSMDCKCFEVFKGSC